MTASLTAYGMYCKLPTCVDHQGHRFSIGLWHKDRAVCERCGLIKHQPPEQKT